MKTIIAKEYLCFDALLEMIISHADSPAHFTQADLAEILGITLPTGTPTSIKNVQYSDSLMDCGTKICISDINDFFRDNLIPLHLRYISSNYFDEMTFVELIKKNNQSYIVFAFNYGLLYNEPQNNDVGHVALLEAVNTQEDTIRIYDPGPRNYGSKVVKADDLVYAMKRRGGIYLFEKIER